MDKVNEWLLLTRTILGVITNEEKKREMELSVSWTRVIYL